MRRVKLRHGNQGRICEDVSQETVGDREGHVVTSFQYSCYRVDGFLKGDVATTVVAIERDGPAGTFLSLVKFQRETGGVAISQNIGAAGN